MTEEGNNCFHLIKHKEEEEEDREATTRKKQQMWRHTVQADICDKHATLGTQS